MPIYRLIPAFIVMLFLASCQKEEVRIESFDPLMNYDVVTPEPLIQGFIELLTEEKLEAVYLPVWELSALDNGGLSEELRSDWLRNTGAVFLYQEELHPAFEEFFELSEKSETDSPASSNVFYLREANDASPYPWILRENLVADIEVLAGDLKKTYPDLASTIDPNMESVRERLTALDEYTVATFSEITIPDTVIYVESETMKTWLENAFQDNLKNIEIKVIPELMNTEPELELEQFLDPEKSELFLLTSLSQEKLFSSEEELKDIRFVHFETGRGGYTGPDSWFENMVQNVKVLTLALASSG